MFLKFLSGLLLIIVLKEALCDEPERENNQKCGVSHRIRGLIVGGNPFQKGDYPW
jgi:hypothetical protein